MEEWLTFLVSIRNATSNGKLMSSSCLPHKLKKKQKLHKLLSHNILLTSFRVTASSDTAQPMEWSFLHNKDHNLSSTVPNLSYGTKINIPDKQATTNRQIAEYHSKGHSTCKYLFGTNFSAKDILCAN